MKAVQHTSALSLLLLCLFVLPAITAQAVENIKSKPDFQMQEVLDELASLKGKPIETLSAKEARKQPTPADAVKKLLKKKQGKLLPPKPEKVANIDNRKIDGPGGKIPIRIYTPVGKGPFPVIVYYHGGGWVIADLDTYDATPRALANAVGAIVVSSHYRQAPEHKFPAAHEDTFAAYEWTLKHAKEFNGNPQRIALVGESVGGNMAAAVSVQARNKGLQMPLHQVLIYPVTQYKFDTPSYIENANAKPLNLSMMKWFFGQYLNSPPDGQNSLISLVNETNLKGLPPTTIITAQIDPLRSDGKEYADKLEKAGVKVYYRNFDGVTHEFFGMGAVVDTAKQALRFAAENLTLALK